MTPTWDEYFATIAQAVATKSKDPSTQVGAVVVADRRIVGTGYNGPPRSVDDTDLSQWSRDERLRCTIHAEVNALMDAGRRARGATIYVTHAPCAACAATIIQAGVARVVAPQPEALFAARWGESFTSAARMFREAGIDVANP